MRARVSVLFLAASVLMTQPAFARLAKSPLSSTVSPAPSLMAELSNIEQAVFGETSGKPLGERVARLETTTFGQVRLGALADRVHALDLAIQQGNVGQAAPAQQNAMPLVAPPAHVSNDDAKARAKALIATGVEKARSGDTPGAQAAFEEASALDDKNPDSFYNLGAIEEQNHDYAGAANFYAKASSLAPNDAGLSDAWASVQKTLSMNTTVPTPLQPSFPLRVETNDANATAGTATAGVPITAAQPGHPKWRAFAKDVGVALKYTLVTAAVVGTVVLAAAASSNGSISVGGGPVDSCACPR